MSEYQQALAQARADFEKFPGAAPDFLHWLALQRVIGLRASFAWGEATANLQAAERERDESRERIQALERQVEQLQEERAGALEPIGVGDLYHDSDDELQTKLNDMYNHGYEPIACLGVFDYHTKWVFKARTK